METDAADPTCQRRAGPPARRRDEHAAVPWGRDGIGDPIEAVAENRQRTAARLGARDRDRLSAGRGEAVDPGPRRVQEIAGVQRPRADQELGHLAGSTRIKTLTAGDSKARLSIADHAVTIRLDGLTWEVLPDGGAPVHVDLVFDPHERKFVGDPLDGKDGLTASSRPPRRA